jgi:integrase
MGRVLTPRPAACEDAAVGSIQKTSNGRYRARYRDSSGHEHLKRFALRRDAQRWLDQETSKLKTGTWVAPRTAKRTVGQWCDEWLRNYATRKPSTVRQGHVHVDRIKEEFGGRRLDSVRPSEVKAWLVSLKEEGYSDSYIYALHERMRQVYSDAVHDGLVARSPLWRRTSPGMGRQRPYVATTEQIWALHDAMEPRYRAGLLLAAFAGLRLAEVCGLRVADVDFMRGIVHPIRQYPDEELKTETSRTPVPIPQAIALLLSAHVEDSRPPGSYAPRPAGRWGRGSCSGPSGLRGRRCRACRKASGSMTSGTSTQACSSPRGWM